MLSVAPSRARGLKQCRGEACQPAPRRAFTGAWVETAVRGHHQRRVHVAPSRARGLKHGHRDGPDNLCDVAPSRARGLKRFRTGTCRPQRCVAPSRARGLKPPKTCGFLQNSSRAFTGAWVETIDTQSICAKSSVAPSRARGLKLCLNHYVRVRHPRRAFTGAWVETQSLPTP